MYESFIVLNYLTAYFDGISFILLKFYIELQSDFQAHVAECKFKQVPCQQCGNLIEPQALQDHMSKECTKRKIACKHCQLEVVVENLEVCLYRGILVHAYNELIKALICKISVKNQVYDTFEMFYLFMWFI